MRKIFTFLFVALLTTNLWATQTVVPAGTSTPENQVKAAIDAASAGDTIVLETANYVEWQSITVDKKITIMAAEGAKPKLALYNWQIQSDFEINGVEITNVSTDNYLFRVNAAVAGTVAFKNCSMQCNAGTITTTTPYILLEKGVGTLTIDNCTFAPNAKTEGAIVYGLTTVNNFTMTKSTAVACGGTDLAVYMTGLTTATVDHCTFYNCGARVLYLKGDAMTSCAVSNCIVANAALVDQYCVATYAGTVDNVLYYNTKAPHSTDATVNGCINADPLFADPANGDFNFSIFSPLCFAATDGKHIGDPRWEAQSGAGIDFPTDATPVVLDKGNVGAVSADMTYYSEDEEYFDFGPNDDATDTLRWAKWLVNVNKRAYSVSAELTSKNGYKLVLDVIDPSTGAVVLTSDTAKNSPSFKTIDFSGLEEKSYILRLKNRQGWSKVKVKSLTFTYTGGAEVNLPGTLPNEDAILGGNDKVKVDEEGYICFSEDGNVPNCYAKWNANFTKKGKFEVSLSVSTTNGHQLAIQVLDGENVISETTPKWLGASGNLVLGIISVPQQGNYTIKFINTLSSSAARVKDITLTYAGGGIVEIPGTLLPADAMLSEKAFIDNDTIIFAPRGAEGHTPDGWAKWNVTLEESTLCSFKANCHKFSGNTMKIKISVINSENDTIYQKEENVENNGDSEVALDSIMLAAGDYVIQMQNTVKNSKGRLMSVVVDLVITDYSDIDFTAYAGRTVNVQLIRTFKANMYNPLCLPFAVSDELFQQIFKSTKSFILSEASLENQKLFVKLAENYGIYQGTPVMVKPSEDVVNPIFENVEIITANPSSTTKGPLCLRGTFASHELENKENVLLVGANNTLFFPSDDAPHIKSMRAYFELQNVEPSQMPRFAAFVEPGNAPTEMIIVGGEAERQKGHRKVLVDGQIRIQHEGKCYSILGLER